MKTKISSFTGLQAWQESHKLVIAIFKTCSPLSKQDVLRNQIERAALSITSNIAEGFGRDSVNDKRHFYVIARASTFEVQSQLLVIRDTKKISEAQFQEMAALAVTSIRLLHGLIHSLERRRLVPNS